MDPGTAIASAWSSGISMYGVAALLGLAGRLGWTDPPAWLTEPWVIGAAGVLFLVEFVVDKFPVVDSAWDAVHTALRPMAGAVLLGGAGLDWSTAAYVAGGGLALTSHSAKASLRSAVNASPEPFSNVIVSLAEDVLVVIVMVLALLSPEVALALTLVLALIAIVTAVVLFRFLLRLVRRIRSWLTPSTPTTAT